MTRTPEHIITRPIPVHKDTKPIEAFTETSQKSMRSVRAADGKSLPIVRHDFTKHVKKVGALVILLLAFASSAHAEQISNADMNYAVEYVKAKLGIPFLHPGRTQNPKDFETMIAMSGERLGIHQALGVEAGCMIAMPPYWDRAINMPDLVHEAVHCAQETYPQLFQYPCIRARERLAYEIENDYIRESGVNRPLIPESHIAYASACR